MKKGEVTLHLTVKKALKSPLHDIIEVASAIAGTPLAHHIADWQCSGLDQGSVVASEQRKIENIFDKDRTDEALLTSQMAHRQPDVSSLIEPYRGELYLHCYRLLGSVHDAEDMVQETLFRAWRRFDTFKGEASLRTWLYTIATNACLDALKKRSSRTMPTAVYPEASVLNPNEGRTAEALWLEPFPDSWMGEVIENPEARYTRSESVSFAFLTALQVLPPRQRAILLLSDVLDWRASEIAHLLEISVSAVNSALHRARVTLEKQYHADKQVMMPVNSADEEIKALLSRYVLAWETDDVAGLVALLKEDAILSMPPIPAWYRGPEAIYDLLLIKFAEQKNQWRFFPTSANGQPAFVVYRLDKPGNFYKASGIQVVTLDDSSLPRKIADITALLSPSLVATFGFPLQLPE